jgi:hypothetical protein
MESRETSLKRKQFLSSMEKYVELQETGGTFFSQLQSQEGGADRAH